MTANQQRRLHYMKQAEAKKQVGDVVHWHATRMGLRSLGQSVVTVIWYAPDRRRRDTDGLGPFLKAALDALTRAGAWPDDHSDWVVETRLRIDKTETSNPRIEIVIEELNT